MAVVAAEDDRFGFGEAQLVTSRPLMARPAMPRFMRAGDTLAAGVILTSKGLAASEVEVGLVAVGAEVSGEATRRVLLPSNGSVEVRWAISTPHAGTAKFSFRARTKGASDDVAVTREIMVPASPEAVALYGETSSAVAEKLGDLRSIRADTGGLDVRLSSTALIGLDEGVEHLIQYPYGCTEQLTSRLVPLLPLRDLAKDYGIALPNDIDATIEKTVAKLVRNERPDGGFGWWPDSQGSDTWITAYALWGLNLAKTHGTHVPDEAIANATGYVRSYLSSLETRPGHAATSAFILDVLAEIGSPDTGFADRLYERRATMPIFARALLAHAMVKSKMSAASVAELTKDLEGHLRVSPAAATVVENLGDDYAALMDSEARTTAMVLRALVAADPKHPLAARLAKGLLAARKGGTWRSTQETAWALLALDDYRRAQESQAPNFDGRVLIGENEVLSAPFHRRTTIAASASFVTTKLLDAGAAGSTLAFQVQGNGKLFYEARLRYAKTELPREALDRGFFVRKYMRSVAPAALREALGTLPQTSTARADVGDLILIDLIVVSPDPREQVVLDDPLPAGLEAVQSGLATTATSLGVTEPNGEGDDADREMSDDDARANGRAYNESSYHREVHDDRVLTFVTHMAAGMFHYRYLARATTSGRFIVPPTRVECMYEPETFGRTGGGIFEVNAR